MRTVNLVTRRNTALTYGESSPLGVELPEWHLDERLPCKVEPDRWYSTSSAESRGAAAECVARCPFVEPCRVQARGLREEFGVWGGETPAQRARALAEQDAGPSSGPTLRGPTCGHPAGEFRVRGDGSVWCRRCDRERAAERRRNGAGVGHSARSAKAAERRDRVMAAYHALAPRELSRDQAAAALGMPVPAFRRLYQRAAECGDPRAVPHTRAGRLAAEAAARRAG